ncbi:transporter substrate-binding domain-containing protein [Salibacter sp.]|uniref:transporter substrate-binding domain-containing protein n=2 Tax=Salibacter sp. TaxID=2010995 RepID=UPI00287074D5|nr:transporter substrate-binding domain-containing protein [Salibacter sp.]MDR9487764.1 transporter substrate-binding domain-containing protein [Salibacter sp.]
MKICKFFLIPLFAIISTVGFSKAADSVNSKKQTIKVGIKPAPPFVYEDQGVIQGLSVELWQLVDGQLGSEYEYVKYETIDELIDATANGEVDLSINPVTVTSQRMQKLDFSQPYYISSTTLAQRDENEMLKMMKNLFSADFFSATLVLVIVIFIFGLLIWVFEKGKNEEFRKGSKGIGDGFWWSAVTMTTVGYGDKSPRTFGGRVIGFIWMFAAIILISGLTASIASSLTVQSLDAQVQNFSDLKKFSVGTVQNTSTSKTLTQNGVSFQQYTTIEEGLEALKDDKLDFFVYDKPILNHFIKTKGYNDELVIVDKTLKTDYYSFMFPKGSELRSTLDPIIVEQIKSPQWEVEMAK